MLPRLLCRQTVVHSQESSTAPFPSNLAFTSADVRKAFAKSDKAIEFFRFEIIIHGEKTIRETKKQC